MQSIQVLPQVPPVSMISVIELVKQTRNALIQKFFNADFLQAYFFETYQIAKLSNVKAEFLNRDLKEALAAPVDLVHYASIIREVKTLNNPQLINHPVFQKLFIDELQTTFKKYSY